MENKVYIDETKVKAKGNLHTHTTASDGKYDLREVVKKYKALDYDFLSITDHRKYYQGNLQLDGVCMIPGIEVSCLYDGSDPYKEYSYTHFNVFGIDLDMEGYQVFHYQTIYDLNNILKKLQTRNGLIAWNHPLFSRFTEDEALQLQGYDMIEVYNHKDMLDETGYDSATYLVRSILRHHYPMMVSATNDFHGKNDPILDDFYSQAFIKVDVEEMNSESILGAMRNGHFYASYGPEIFDYRVEDNCFKIKTSPVQHIVFYSNLRHCKNIFKVDGLVNEGSYQLQGDEEYIWVMIIDSTGKKAWTQPMIIPLIDKE